MEESPIKSEFNPAKVVVLSELPMKEKEKYYQLLLMNNAKFIRDSEGKYIANLRLLAPGIKKIDPILERKKKDGGNYALTFQERLTKLRQEGFIQVQIVGVQPFDYNAFPRFTALIAFRNEIVKPKVRHLSWVMKLVEDIYDNRFAHEKHDVEREDDAPSFDLILLIFPVFVVRRLGTRVGLKSLLDQTCWDLMYSTHVYRQDYLELEIFARFLQEFYDHDDLLFFLYVRSVICKVLHISFKTRWQKFDGPGRQPRAMWMTYREAVHVARIVFGTDNDDLFRDFLALITPQMVGEKSELVDTRRIDMTEYLHLSVVGYHQSQARGGNNNQLLVPIPGQTVPPEPVPLPPNRGDLERMQDILNSPPQGSGYGGQQPQGGQIPLHDDEDYDPLDEEERAYEEEFHRQQQQLQQGGRGSSTAFERVAALPLEQQLRQGYGRQPSQQLASQGGGGDDCTSGLRGGYDDINDDDQQQQQPEQQSEVDGQQHQPNAFEEQQQGREMEFMSQLCNSLVDAPPDVYQYVEAQLWENLHQTVSMLLADKEITDLDTLDAALLEILSLDQLREDMEGMRDEILAELMPSK